jgi:hypothetical protein
VLLSELHNLILIESGEYIIADVGELQLNLNSFWTLTKRCLSWYERFIPHTIRDLQIQLNTQPYNFSSQNVVPTPEWISRVVPSNLAISILSFYYGSAVIGPISLVWRYYKPILYVSFAGEFMITAHYKYTTNITTDNEGNISEVDLCDIDENKDYRFIELLKYYFLRSLSRSRSMFTLSEIPLTSDANSIYAYSQEKISEIENDIRNAGQWFESIG